MNENVNGASAPGPSDEPEPESDYLNMDEEAFERFLTFAIDGYADIMETPCKPIRTFSEAGVMTKNKGLVVEIGGAEFQVTIVKNC